MKWLQRRTRAAWLLLCLAMGLWGCQSKPIAGHGTLDLHQWDFIKQGAVALVGQWQAYEGHLLTPDELAYQTTVAPSLAHLPSPWRRTHTDGTSLGPTGVATYRLRVLVPPTSAALAIAITEQSTAYELWINGRLTAKNGVVGPSRQTTSPELAPRIVPLSPSMIAGGSFDLLLRVANFHAGEGGVTHPILLGPEVGLRLSLDRLRALDGLICGLFLALAFYHLTFFLLRRQERSFLALGVLGLVITLRQALEGLGGRPILTWCPTFPVEAISRLEVATLLLVVALATTFIASFFRNKAYTLLVLPTWILTSVLGLAATVTPLSWHRLMIGMVEAWAVGGGIWVLGNLILDVWRRVKDAAPVLAGYVTFYGFAAYDIFVDNGLVRGPYLLPLGVLSLTLAFAFILSHRMTRSYAAVERLSQEATEKNEALARLDALKDDFLAHTTHELRTPIAGIVGLAEAMHGGRAELSPAELADNLTLIAATGRRLGNLINDILDFSRLRHHDITLQLSAVTLQPLVQFTVALLSANATIKGLRVENLVPVSLPPIRADSARFQQILQNLLGNAIKFTSAGWVRIEASARDREVDIVVADSGCGIAPESLPSIFEAYTQLRTTTVGSGLGLAVTRQLVELHGGRISVASEPGVGSRFTVTLPRATPEDSSAPGWAWPSLPVGPAAPPMPVTLAQSSTAEEDPLDGLSPRGAPVASLHSRATVLVVDDDPVSVQVTKAALVFAGHFVQCAHSAAAALAAIDKEEPDLALLDVSMPEMSGYELCAHLREQYNASELPVIMLTANNRTADIVASFQFGASDFISKPYSQEELVARVSAQLAIKEAYERLDENRRLLEEIELRRQQQDEAHRQTELARQETLRYQLAPHFLFNALSSIRGALATSPSIAAEMVTNLADYCHHVLGLAVQDSRSLSQEFELVRLYLKIEQARWHGDLEAKLTLDDQVATVSVPALLLQPLVENAIKHGRVTSPERLCVRINARKLGPCDLELLVANSGCWRNAAEVPGRTGLANVKRRLSLAFGDQASLSYGDENGSAIVRILIHRAPLAPAAHLASQRS